MRQPTIGRAWGAKGRKVKVLYKKEALGGMLPLGIEKDEACFLPSQEPSEGNERYILAILQCLTLLGGKFFLYQLRFVGLFHMHAGVLFKELLSKEPGGRVSIPALMGVRGGMLRASVGKCGRF